MRAFCGHRSFLYMPAPKRQPGGAVSGKGRPFLSRVPAGRQADALYEKEPAAGPGCGFSFFEGRCAALTHCRAGVHRPPATPQSGPREPFRQARAAGQPYLGKKLGIQLHAPVPGDMDTNKWIFLDNVRLDLDFAADFNGDDDINFLDYALLADAWMTAPGHPQYNDIYDLHDNDIIDMLDLDIFVEKWLWQTEP